MNKTMQYKTLKVADIKADEQENIIKGYASHFNNKDSHGDIITAGAFKKTISENKDRIKVLWQHQMDEPIGLPLEMKEDSKGLYTVSKISMTETGKKAMILARDGVLNEMSIGYYPIKEKFDTSKNANMITEIKLLEYSVVTIASNPLATFTDVKQLFNEYAYSKGNIMDIFLETLIQKMKALDTNNEPSTNTQIITEKSLDSNEIEELIKRIRSERKYG